MTTRHPTTDGPGAGALPRPSAVPYIATWSGETALTPTVTATRRGLAYIGEQPHDRDRNGVLWASRTHAPEQGRPDLGGVHPLRQRRAMQRLLCQVCAQPADRDDELGVLWLIEDDRADSGGAWDGWPERAVTTHPPVCAPCAALAVAECHHLLRTPWVALRVASSVVEGVYGRRWHLDGGRLVPGQKDVVYYGTPQARWTVAGQLVRTLHDCTIVDLPTP